MLSVTVERCPFSPTSSAMQFEQSCKVVQRRASLLQVINQRNVCWYKKNQVPNLTSEEAKQYKCSVIVESIFKIWNTLVVKEKNQVNSLDAHVLKLRHGKDHLLHLKRINSLCETCNRNHMGLSAHFTHQWAHLNMQNKRASTNHRHGIVFYRNI